METRKLYYEDPFQKGFATTVVSCDAVKGGYAVVLAETAFYPEGGGQPYDTGVLGEANVLEVHEKNGVITHLCDKPFEVGKSVSGKIDWARRFDHMQQHSGEHICSGLICERFHCDNVGFHMGADVVTIDFNADISWDELMEIEQLANLYIYEDHPIDIQFYRGAELDKVEYRSKKPLEGDVRIVSFPGADCCACCVPVRWDSSSSSPCRSSATAFASNFFPANARTATFRSAGRRTCVSHRRSPSSRTRALRASSACSLSFPRSSNS